MKITPVLLFLAGASIAVGLPAQDRSQREQTPQAVPNQAQQQPNFGFGNFPQLGNGGGSWPMGQGIGQRFDQPQWPQFGMQPNARGGSFDFNLPKIDGVDSVTVRAGMSCSYENGKKKCTNH